MSVLGEVWNDVKGAKNILPNNNVLDFDEAVTGLF